MAIRATLYDRYIVFPVLSYLMRRGAQCTDFFKIRFVLALHNPRDLITTFSSLIKKTSRHIMESVFEAVVRHTVLIWPLVAEIQHVGSAALSANPTWTYINVHLYELTCILI